MTTDTLKILFQKITVKESGSELDLSFLQSATLVETIDVSGPRLMLQLYDPDAVFRDMEGLKPGKEITAQIADVWHSDGLNEEISFVIQPSSPVTGDVFRINCFQSDIHRIKQPHMEGLLFVKKSYQQIMKRLFLVGADEESDIKEYKVDSIPVLERHHLTPGMRRSKLIRLISRELGIQSFFRRGTWVASSLEKMLAEDAEIKYTHGRQYKEENNILAFQRPNAENIVTDRLDRNYFGWNMTDGFIFGNQSSDPASPPIFTQTDQKRVLDHMAELTLPVIDFTVQGNGLILPGMSIDLVWEKALTDDPLDESLPEKIVVGTVAHHYEPQRYYTRVKGVLPN